MRELSEYDHKQEAASLAPILPLFINFLSNFCTFSSTFSNKYSKLFSSFFFFSINHSVNLGFNFITLSYSLWHWLIGLIGLILQFLYLLIFTFLIINTTNKYNINNYTKNRRRMHILYYDHKFTLLRNIYKNKTQAFGSSMTHISFLPYLDCYE